MAAYGCGYLAPQPELTLHEHGCIASIKATRFAYVFLPDGTMLNAEMLKNGKAKVDRSRTFAHQEEFVRLEEEARDAGLGVWAGVPH